MGCHYLDLARLFLLGQGLAFTVIRFLNRLQFLPFYAHSIEKQAALCSDQTIVLAGPLSSRHYP
jgi:hypothetical protein